MIRYTREHYADCYSTMYLELIKRFMDQTESEKSTRHQNSFWTTNILGCISQSPAVHTFLIGTLG